MQKKAYLFQQHMHKVNVINNAKNHMKTNPYLMFQVPVL